MSKISKLVDSLKAKPKDLTWKEVCTLCNSLGFKEVQGSGSRVKFFNRELDCVICLHKPHPSKIIKQYALKQVLDILEYKGLI